MLGSDCCCCGIDIPDIEEDIPDIEEDIPDIEEDIPEIEEDTPEIEERANDGLAEEEVVV